MKKKYLIILIFIFLFVFTACGKIEVDINNNSFTLEFPKESLEYLPYDEIPNFTFNFEGVIRTLKGDTHSDIFLSNQKTFKKNDDFLTSEIIEKFINEYLEKDRIMFRVSKFEKQFETRMNKLEVDSNGEEKLVSQIMKVKEGEVYNEIAHVSLENGLMLTLDYRRFVSDFEGEEKTYYSWTYASSIRMVLHYAFLIDVDSNNKKTLYILTLPPKVTYELGLNVKHPINRMLEKEFYLNENFKMFYYPDYLDAKEEERELDVEDNINQVKSYYERDFNGRFENDIYMFTYLGYDFKIDFDDKYFVINKA